MTKDIKATEQEKIEKTKEDFLKDLQSDELEILDDTAGGMAEDNAGIEGNNWCDSGCGAAHY